MHGHVLGLLSALLVVGKYTESRYNVILLTAEKVKQELDFVLICDSDLQFR